MTRGKPSRLRLIVQLISALFWLGLIVLYTLFAVSLEGGTVEEAVRPTAIEGLTPHLGYLELLYAVRVGGGYGIHLAALGFLVTFFALSLIIKKSFCSHLCPLGTLFDGLHWLGKKITRGKSLRLPAILDGPLRLVKYALLGVFLLQTTALTSEVLRLQIFSPAAKLHDLVLFNFLANPAAWLIYALVSLLVASLFLPRLFCRYLCPYGALLGLASTISPVKVVRDPSRCSISCHDCEGSCPAGIDVHNAETISSDQCNLCLRCLDSCPVPGALAVKVVGKRTLPGWLVTVAVVAITGIGVLLMLGSGSLRNRVPTEEYLERYSQIDTHLYYLQFDLPTLPSQPSSYDGELFSQLRSYNSKPRKQLELIPTSNFELGAAAEGLSGGLLGE
ncbi:4Fe-4S binding protein [bacterium]|nr:4Fe-4S binding protein [bacterium]